MIAKILKISVITVVRNGMPYIEQTLRSVQQQDYPHLEYIVIDGASTDGTVDVIRRYERGISKWISEPDTGIADAFNKGLGLATGDYILFLNADDALADDTVTSAVAAAIEDQHYPLLLYGDCNVLVRDNGEVMHRAVIEYTRSGMLWGKTLPHPGLFAHREYFVRYGDFDRNFRIAMDYEWLLRGALQERVVHVPLLVSNVRSGGLSVRNRNLAVQEILAALRKHGHLPLARALLLRTYFSLRGMAAAWKRSLLRSVQHA